MKFIPISESIIDKAFKKEVALYNKVKRLGNKAKSDNFWAINNHREFKLKDNGKNALTIEKLGDIWRCDFMVNGNRHTEAYSVWRDYPNYHGSGEGKSMDEVLKLSETEKILYTCDEYRIVLLRDRILGKTDTYWGFRILDPVYALIDNKTNEIIIREEKKWRFKKILMDNLANAPKKKTFVDDLREINPFRLFVVNSTDTERMEHLQEKLEMYQDTPVNRYSDTLNKNRWVCYAFGYDNRRGYQSRKNCTWWFVDSETKPTNEECLKALKHILTWYDTEEFVVMLEKCKTHKMDLNKLDLGYIEQVCKKVNEKLVDRVENIFNVREISKFIALIK